MKFLLTSFLILFFLGLPSLADSAGKGPFFSSDDDVYSWDPESEEESNNIVSDGSNSRVHCDGIFDICTKAMDNDPDYRHVKTMCNMLNATAFLEDDTLKNPDKSYTVFLITNEGLDQLWTQQFGYTGATPIPHKQIREVFRNHIIKDKKFKSSDILCGNVLHVLEGSKPRVSCKKTDIAGNPAPFVRGRGNRIGRYFPRIEDPSNPIETCKDSIFIINNGILKNPP